MRLSVIVAAASDRDGLVGMTVDSCVRCCGPLDAEFLAVAADGSPGKNVPGERHVRRVAFRPDGYAGVAAAKAEAVRQSRGAVIVIFEAAALPAPGSIEQLVRDVEFDPGSIVVPRLSALEPWRWRNAMSSPGFPGFLDLETFDRGWAASPPRRAWRHFSVAPAAFGGCLAIGRELYERLGGFDPELRSTGAEDLDLSLRCWMAGHSVWLDPQPSVACDFQAGFQSGLTPQEVVADEIRLARKLFSEANGKDWERRARTRFPEELWERAWALFEANLPSAEACRATFLPRRVRDEHWYAASFGLEWPRPPSTLARRRSTARGFSFPPPPAVGSVEYYRRGRTGRACFEDHCRQPCNAWSVPVEGLAGRLEVAGQEPVVLVLNLVRRTSGEVFVYRTSFQDRGRPEGRAYLSLLTEMVEDRPLREVRLLCPEDLQRVFDAGENSAPDAQRAVDVLRRTLEGL